jgi:predicted ArsR family transcriptional regulator
MTLSRWNQRFFLTTRGQVILLLRRASRTVEELAQALGLTDNGVRAHLVTLERDGLVRQGAPRRGGGKPASTYGLTSEAERLFPQAYGQVLRELLGVLSEQLSLGELELALQETGRRLGSEHAASGDLGQRVEAAIAVLNDLGGLAEMETCDDGFLIRGYNCPLAAIVPGHPDVCRLAEALVEEIVGAPTHERCERGEAPRCCFEIAGSAVQSSGVGAR